MQTPPDLTEAFVRTPMTPAASVGIPCPPCRFGRFALQPDERRLLADGEPVSLGARAFDLLVVLVAHAGRLMSKNELLSLVWSGLVVEENNLQVQISALRKLLGPSALATIPGRGYRFELPVEPMDAAGAAPARTGADAAARHVAHRVGAAGTSPAAASASATSPAGPDARAGVVAPEAEAAPPRVPTNLPARLPSLYGRTSDVDAVLALLERNIVVTVAGAGGIGKTRVAQAVAARIAVERTQDFADGVWWVGFAPLADGALVAATVAQAVDIQLAATRPPAEALAAVLAVRRTLLVLDNCEHVTDDVAALVDTLCARAPGLRILATSQETLKTADEHVYRLGALAVPADGVDASAAHAAGAVALFVARAEAVDPRFVLAPENAPAVVEICRRLDGIPLAIELAAARLPLLGIEGLRARLDERFSVLTAGARVVLRRHQTLRAMFEWSHGLLTTEQQTLFRRLGVFAGSFTLEAAQYVVQDDAIDPWSALDGLGALVDKSLVLAEGEGIPRYRLLETARAYALERLAEAGETAVVTRRHAESLLQLLVAFDAEDALQAPTVVQWRVAAAEVDNLRAALAWTVQPGGDERLAVALIAHSFRVWCACGQMTEGFDRGLAMRRCVRDDLPAELVARFWLTIANLGAYTTRHEAYDAALTAVTAFRALDDPSRLCDALTEVAIQGIRFGSIEAMGAAIAEAQALMPPDASTRRRASLEFARCRWYMQQGKVEESLAAAERQCALSREGGSELGALYATSNVASALLEVGDPDQALARSRAAIARVEELGAPGAGHLWLGVAGAHALRQEVDASLAACAVAYRHLLTEADQLRVFPVCAHCCAMQGRLGDAARLLGHFEAAYARTGAREELYRRRGRRLLEALLDAGLSPEARARLHAEGAAMREEDVIRAGLAEATVTGSSRSDSMRD